MSRADELYRQTCLDILENGFSDEGLEVRPRWAGLGNQCLFAQAVDNPVAAQRPQGTKGQIETLHG